MLTRLRELSSSLSTPILSVMFYCTKHKLFLSYQENFEYFTFYDSVRLEFINNHNTCSFVFISQNSTDHRTRKASEMMMESFRKKSSDGDAVLANCNSFAEYPSMILQLFQCVY